MKQKQFLLTTKLDLLGQRFHWLVVRILCNIQNMIYNTEQVLYNTLNTYYTYILHGRARICREASIKFWYAAKIIQFLHGYLCRVSHYILYVYQFSILTWDGQNDDIIGLLSSQSDDWSQSSLAKDRFYQFHSDFRILFIIPRHFLFSTSNI